MRDRSTIYGTVQHVREATESKADTGRSKPLVSHTGVLLTRDVAYRFALDPTLAQEQTLRTYAGAARYAYNHHVARVLANLNQRQAEASYGVEPGDRTPALSWSKFSFINEFNAFKNGQLATSPVGPDGTAGLPWRGEVAWDVFECASVDAAAALANFAGSRTGTRKGKKAGMARFKSRHKTTPSFRLRSKSKPGKTAPLRVTGPKTLRLPRIGQIRVHGSTRTVRRMLASGRLHLRGCAVRFERGRWWVSLQGVAAQFHAARRGRAASDPALTVRHTAGAGVDRGITSLAVVADIHGALLHVAKGVKALRHAQVALRRANKTHSRTKEGSKGRQQARERLVRIHARVANLRKHAAHEASTWCAGNLTRLAVEELYIAGMVQNHALALAVSDAGMGQVGRMLEYKASWYNLELVPVDRWYPSSKTCSGCGNVKDTLSLSQRLYECAVCGLSIDRDVNAAVNLARWPDRDDAQPGTAAVTAAPSSA